MNQRSNRLLKAMKACIISHCFAAQLREQQAEAAKLDMAIARNLKELGYG